MAEFITGSICVSDIPKSAIKKANNGKLYINIVIAERKEVGKFGETHAIFMSQTKEEREAKADKCYIGSGQAYAPKPEAVTADDIASAPAISAVEADDLPF